MVFRMFPRRNLFGRYQKVSVSNPFDPTGRLRTKKPHDKMEEPVSLIVCRTCSLIQRIMQKCPITAPLAGTVKMNRNRTVSKNSM